MGLELRQSLKLSQQLVMTPQLQQAIRLLQLSRVELVELVQQELMENPLLEEKEESVAEQPVEERPTEELQSLKADEQSLERSAEWEDYLGDFSSTSKQALAREYEAVDEGFSYEGRIAQKPSLEGHLRWQISLSDMDKNEQRVAEEIIGNLSSTGYLDSDLKEIALSLKVDEKFAEEVLKKIQVLDPIGIAARSPQECLIRQLEVAGEEDPIIYELIEHYLPHIERRDFRPVLRALKISLEDLKAYIEIIQRLDPMPGAWYGQTESIYVSPDVYVYEYNGEFLIVLNEDGIPGLQVSTLYEDLEKAGESASEYINEKTRSAVWLIKSLYQRQRTLYKVAESITRFQADFFREGVSKLKPLILREVADDIEMHESTVSRITTSKYMATAHGVFELKFFFNSALDQGTGGAQVGSESVKDAIRKLIAGEDKTKPLSDEKICELLKEELKVNIARRTVAKYRSALDIPSSSRRRHLF